jgi:hypothetical protein
MAVWHGSCHNGEQPCCGPLGYFFYPMAQRPLYGQASLAVEGYAVAQWLRHCDTNRKVAGSIPDGVIGIFH